MCVYTCEYYTDEREYRIFKIYVSNRRSMIGNFTRGVFSGYAIF